MSKEEMWIAEVVYALLGAIIGGFIANPFEDKYLASFMIIGAVIGFVIAVWRYER